ncbi:MAG: radical SAM protein [Planctomycetes bacterium]|nr:radical SAM protein [Planctomycetota bacterium]MCP4771233.1 radical SAM protein [Planctomycetota bacterium]MCP4862040.1 radical SAM protein [Planctomycetota bacterium]
MITYQGSVFRPPSEANSLILQATLGCSWNRCTFCAMYREKSFRVRKIADLQKEIEWYASNFSPPRKVFLADGDAHMAKASFLAELLDLINATWPDVKRVTCYASPQSLAVRSVEEMEMLRSKKLTQYYLGIESGNDQVLVDIDKGVDGEEMIRVANKAHAAGVKLSTMILLGMGQRALSREHAVDSARVVNAIQPKFVSTLVVTPVEGTPLWNTQERGEFETLSPIELAAELREFLAHTELKSSIFRSNHASNYLSVAGTLPKDKDTMVRALDQVLNDPANARFKPEWLRAL